MLHRGVPGAEAQTTDWLFNMVSSLPWLKQIEIYTGLVS